MADSFFDGTLDDFLDGMHDPNQATRPAHNAKPPILPVVDQEFLELAGFALPFNSPPQNRVGDGDGPLFVPSDVPGPTRPGASDRLPAALPHSELSRRLNASPRTIENPTPASFPLHPPTRLPVVSAPLNSSRSAFASNLPLHGLPSLSAAAASNPRQRNHSENFRNQTHSRDLPRPFPQRRTPHRNHTSDIPTTVHFAPAAGFFERSATESANADYDSDNTPLASPTMSSNTRRRSVRPTDLTMPSAPSQAGPSRAAPRTRRSASRALQPEKSASTTTTKRKREQDDDDDLFGDSIFAGQEVVDLVDKDEVPADLLNSKEQNKNYVKLSRFDCVICMDNVKDLTVTHCGKATSLSAD